MGNTHYGKLLGAMGVVSWHPLLANIHLESTTKCMGHPRICVMVKVIAAPCGVPQTPLKSLNIMCLCMQSISDHQVCIGSATTSPKKDSKGCHLAFLSRGNPFNFMKENKRC